LHGLVSLYGAYITSRQKHSRTVIADWTNLGETMVWKGTVVSFNNSFGTMIFDRL